MDDKQLYNKIHEIMRYNGFNLSNEEAIADIVLLIKQDREARLRSIMVQVMPMKVSEAAELSKSHLYPLRKNTWEAGYNAAIDAVYKKCQGQLTTTNSEADRG